MNKIDRFDGEYRFLSNFWPTILVYEGQSYPSVEHAFQAAKTLDAEERRGVALQKTPAKAKYAGRSLALRKDWENVKYNIMHTLVHMKFNENPALAEKLLATGEAELIEGNTWNDTCWGVCNGVGTNWLGKILMEVRTQIKHKQIEQVYAHNIPV